MLLEIDRNLFFPFRLQYERGQEDSVNGYSKKREEKNLIKAEVSVSKKAKIILGISEVVKHFCVLITFSNHHQVTEIHVHM